jgi:hypothetical protein
MSSSSQLDASMQAASIWGSATARQLAEVLRRLEFEAAFVREYGDIAAVVHHDFRQTVSRVTSQAALSLLHHSSYRW